MRNVCNVVKTSDFGLEHMPLKHWIGNPIRSGVDVSPEYQGGFYVEINNC